MSLTPRQRLLTAGVIALGLATAIAALAEATNLVGAGLALLLTSAVVGLVDVRRRQGDLAARLKSLIASEQRATDRLMAPLEAIDAQGTLTTKRLESHWDLVERSSSELKADVAALDQRLSAIPGSVDKHVVRQLQHHAAQIEGLFQLYGDEHHTDAMPLSGGWAIDAANLSAVLNAIERRRPQVVLEFGSGTSTVWVGKLLRRMNVGRVISLDHITTYADATRAAVDLLGVGDQVDIRVVDLVPTGIEGHSTLWYDSSVLDDIAEVDVILVDGPPANTGPLARYPVLPLFFDRMSDDAVIMVDDATRADETQMIDRWKREFPSLREEVPVPHSTLRVLRKRAAPAVSKSE